MKIPCNIVQDLLPSYIDELCSEETTKQVGEHLEKCQSCEKKYKEMKGDLPEKLISESEDVLPEEFQPMKKIKKRHSWQVAVLVIAIAFVAVAGSVTAVKGSNDGYNKGYSEGTDEGYSAGYSEGTDEGYNTGYSEGTDEGYNAGYTEGYVEGSAENPDILTIQVDTQNIGELFSRIRDLMKEKWNTGEELYVVREKDRDLFYLPELRLCLSDDEAVYIIEGFIGFGNNTLTMEVKRVEPDAIDILETCFRFDAFVECMKEMGLSLNERWGRKAVSFTFSVYDELRKSSNIGINIKEDDNLEEWIYRDGQVEKVLENTVLEGAGAFYLVFVVCAEWMPDTEPENIMESIKMYNLYIETK